MPVTETQHPTPAEMYDQYIVPAIFIPWTPVLLEYAASQPGERVLDLACGTGIVARSVAPIVGEAGKVVALDVNPDMLAVARRYPAPEGAGIEWVEGNAVAHALPDDAFELVLCQQGFQFFPDRAAAAREMRRVLRAGGRVVLSVWQALHHQPVYEALSIAEARHLGVPLADMATPFSFGDAEALRAVLTDAGFQRIEIIPRSIEVHFPSPQRFVDLTLLAAASIMEEFTHQDPEAHSSLVEAIRRDIDPVMQRYRNGDRLSFAMPAHVAVAHA